MNNEFSNDNNNGFDNSSLNIFNGGTVDSNPGYVQQDVPMDTFDGAINNNSPELNIFGGVQNQVQVENNYVEQPLDTSSDINQNEYEFNYNEDTNNINVDNNSYTQESDMTNTFDNSYTQESDMTNTFDNGYTQESDMTNTFDNSYAQESDMTNTFDNGYAQESDMTNTFDNSYAQESDMTNTYDNGYAQESDMTNTYDNSYAQESDMTNTYDNGYNQQSDMLNSFDNGYNQQSDMLNSFDNSYAQENQPFGTFDSGLSGYMNEPGEEPEPDYGPKIVKPELHALNDKPIETQMNPNQLSGSKAAKGYIIFAIIIGILLFFYFTSDFGKDDGPDKENATTVNVYATGTSMSFGDYKMTVLAMSDESCLKWKTCNSKLQVEMELGKEGKTKSYTLYADGKDKKLDDGKYINIKPEGDKLVVTIYGVKNK